MRRSLTIVLFFIFFIGCDDRFEEINTNELVPTTASPGAILPAAIFNDGFYNSKFFEIYEIMQYTANLVLGTQLDFRVADGIWNESYATIANLNDLLEITAGNEVLDAYTATAKILRAYYLAILTDLYIDIPLEDSGAGLQGIIFPTYAKQEAVFSTILQELREANDILAADPQFTQEGDILYNGNASKWRKLCNSLRVRYLVRIAEVSDGAITELQEIINDQEGNPIFQNNADDAILDYSGDVPFFGPYDNTFVNDFVSAGTAYVQLLSAYDDPRLDFFFDLPRSGASEHVGISPGLTPGEIEAEIPFPQFNSSLVSQRFIETRGLIDYTFMTYCELNFLLAEASLNGWITGDAETYYYEAIRSNLSFWELEVPADFLDQPAIAWNGSLERLINQKWAAALYLFEFEVWSDYKRLGLPRFDLPPLAFPSTNGEIPTRMIYPAQEQVVNLNPTCRI